MRRVKLVYSGRKGTLIDGPWNFYDKSSGRGPDGRFPVISTDFTVRWDDGEVSDVNGEQIIAINECPINQKHMTDFTSKLFLSEAIDRVEEIRAKNPDYEAQHGMQDALYLRFIKCCEQGMYDLDEITHVAREILKTQEIPMLRFSP